MPPVIAYHWRLCRSSSSLRHHVIPYALPYFTTGYRLSLVTFTLEGHRPRRHADNNIRGYHRMPRHIQSLPRQKANTPLRHHFSLSATTPHIGRWLVIASSTVISHCFSRRRRIAPSLLPYRASLTSSQSFTTDASQIRNNRGLSFGWHNNWSLPFIFNIVIEPRLLLRHHYWSLLIEYYNNINSRFRPLPLV